MAFGLGIWLESGAILYGITDLLYKALWETGRYKEIKETSEHCRSLPVLQDVFWQNISTSVLE